MKKDIFLAAGALLSGFACVVAAQAQNTVSNMSETEVFGAAETPNGNQKFFLVEQPADAPNPLGNPLPDNSIRPDKEQAFSDNPKRNSRLDEDAKEVLKPQIEVRSDDASASDAQALGNDFQNTLTEADGRIYDIQSYPEQDIKFMSNPSNPETIYSPNVND